MCVCVCVCVCVRSCARACVHTFKLCVYVCANLSVYHQRMHIFLNVPGTYRRTQTHAHRHTRTDTRAHAHIRAHIRMHAHTNTHTPTPMHTNERAHARTLAGGTTSAAVAGAKGVRDPHLNGRRRLLRHAGHLCYLIDFVHWIAVPFVVLHLFFMRMACTCRLPRVSLLSFGDSCFLSSLFPVLAPQCTYGRCPLACALSCTRTRRAMHVDAYTRSFPLFLSYV